MTQTRGNPRLPSRTDEQKKQVSALINQRDPGLRGLLHKLHTIMGAESWARADIPFERAMAAGHPMENIATNVQITGKTARNVSVLRRILALGLDAYLAEEGVRCVNCRLVLDSCRVQANPKEGGEVAWWHRATGLMFCEDRKHKATPPEETG